MFERNYFSIHQVSYVLNRCENKVVVDKILSLSFSKSWKDGSCDLDEVHGELNGNQKLRKKIYQGIVRRWTYGWKMVDKNEIRRR